MTDSTTTTPKTRFEQFIEDGRRKGREDYIKEIEGNGGFEYTDQVLRLIQLSNNLNWPMLSYLFGDQLGEYLIQKFAIEKKRNLLEFLNSIDRQQCFFILHELKTNKSLFAHG